MLRVFIGVTLIWGLLLSYSYADDSMILYLPLDEGAGTTVSDESDYGNSGVLTGNITWVGGKIGEAIELVATSYVELPEIPAYDITDSVSLMAWIKTTSVTTWARIIDKSQWQDNGFDLAISMDTHAPLFEFFVDNTTSQALATTTIDDGQWHFIAGTFGAKMARIYVNGVMENEITSTGSVDIKPNDLPIRIGCEANNAKGQPYTGAIDEVAIFNRELSAAEIQDIYANGVDISSPVEIADKLATTWGKLKD